MTDCIFCKIIAGEIPSKKVYEDEGIVAIYDIEPNAPTHILIIPKLHIESIAEITPENADVIGRIAVVIANIARELGLVDGYRVVTNVGKHGAQSVKHLHFHLLGGRQLPGQLG